MMTPTKKKSTSISEDKTDASLGSNLLNRYGILLAILMSCIALYRTGSSSALQPKKSEKEQSTILPNETINVVERFKYFDHDPNGIYDAKKAMDARYNNLLKWCHIYSDVMKSENTVFDVPVPSGSYMYEVESQISFCVNECLETHSMIKDMFDRLRGLSKHATLTAYDAFYTRFPDMLLETRKAILALSPMDMLVNAYRHIYEESIDYKTGKIKKAPLSFAEYIDVVCYGAKQISAYLTELGEERSSLAVDTGLVDGKGDSRCWKPHWQQCGICNNTYKPHYILHLDHLEEDLKVLIEMMNNPKIGLEWLSSMKTDLKKIRDFFSWEMTMHYWSQITKSTIREIIEKYAIDFEVFGFDPEYYIQFGKD